MTEWKTYRLGNVCKKVCSGGTPKSTEPSYYDGDIPWLNTKEINFNRIYSTERSITQKGLDNSSAKWIDANCVIVAMYGATAAKVAINKIPLTTNQACCNLSIDEKIADYHYVYYWLCANYTELASLANGGAQQNLNAQQIKDFEISLPSLEEQRRIAGILGAIDDKIENNRRINTNLELQAQALYKQWFVDFEFPNEEGKPYKSSGGKMVDSALGLIPESWSVGALSDLADITMGQSPNGKSFNENGEGIVFYQGRTEFGIRYPSIRLYTTEPTRYAEPMSVLLSVRAPVGDINIATQKCCIGRGVASIKSKTADNAYMYCCLKELRPQLDQYNGEGTVFGSINRKELEGLALCIPKNEVISQFNNLVLGMDRQMLNLFQQTQNLATLRDALLPKLMNGEIK